jgi:cysteine sulfinate desulfinase/cysteine desulfurase-like protein
MEESAGREINYLRLSITDIPEESRVLGLDQQSIAFSPATACRSGSPHSSHALLAMGLSEDQAHDAIRLSLGADNTREHITRTLTAMEAVLHDSLSSVRFVPCR